MALPPSTAAAPPPDMGAAPPPDIGAPPDAGADTGDQGDSDSDGEVIATICRMPDGTFKLYSGDEPEEGGEDVAAGAPGEGEPPAPEPQTFDSGPALLKAVMALIENDSGAEKSFGDAFASKGKMGEMPSPGM